MDIVKFLQTEVLELNWIFSYGNKSNLNLIQNGFDQTKIYFLLDPVVTNETTISEFGGDAEQDYTISFMLVVQSDMDNVYFEQNNVETDKGKYDKNILPLKTELKAFKDVIDCSELERRSWNTVEAIDQLDANFDGLVVTTILREFAN